jgi:hypothetical protein
MRLAVAQRLVGSASLVERLEMLDEAETLRSACVGSMFGVVETKYRGGSSDRSNWASWRVVPRTGSWNTCHDWYSSVSL